MPDSTTFREYDNDLLEGIAEEESKLIVCERKSSDDEAVLSPIRKNAKRARMGNKDRLVKNVAFLILPDLKTLLLVRMKRKKEQEKENKEKT